MDLYQLKPKFQQTLDPLSGRLLSLGVGPTTVTVSGFVFSLCAAMVFYFSSTNILLLLLIPFFLFLRTASNALDGMMARSLPSVNHAYGEVLNEATDRASDMVICTGLFFIDHVHTPLVAIVMILVLISSYVGILGKAAGGSRRYEGPMGKPDRMFYLSLLSVIIVVTGEYRFANYMLWFIAAGLTATILRRLLRIHTELSS